MLIDNQLSKITLNLPNQLSKITLNLLNSIKSTCKSHILIFYNKPWNLNMSALTRRLHMCVIWSLKFICCIVRSSKLIYSYGYLFINLFHVPNIYFLIMTNMFIIINTNISLCFLTNYPYCDAPKPGGPVDNPSTCGIPVDTMSLGTHAV